MKALGKIRESATCEEAFRLFDQANIGYLTISGIQTTLAKSFKIHLTQSQFLVLIRYMNPSGNGVITLEEFHKFYYESEVTLKEQSKRIIGITLEDIFKSLLDVLKERELTLLEIFSQIDNKTGYITIDDFASMLRTIGHVISEERLVKLLRNDDPSFDGKISYSLLSRHVREVAVKYGIERQLEGWDSDQLFYWRDKAVEGILRALNAVTKDHGSYFDRFDSARLGSLTLKEFREALRSLRAVSSEDIERLLVLLSSKTSATVSIRHLTSYLRHYMSTPAHVRQASFSEELFIDESLFAAIFHHFDGFNVLNTKTYTLHESTAYLANHKDELKARGCSLLSNSLMLARMLRRSQNLVLDLKDLFSQVANSALELLRAKFCSDIAEEAKSRLAASKKRQAVDSGQSYDVPLIDARKIVLDRSSSWTLPSGCVCCRGVYEAGNTPVRVQMYSTKVLAKMSADGRTYKKHLEVELAAQMLLYSKCPELTFKILGKYEKKTGIGEDSVEQHVVFEDTGDDYISLRDFLHTNGGLFDIPVLRSTEVGLCIAKTWLADIFRALQQLHLSALVVRTLSTEHLCVHRESAKIKFGHFRGAGRLDHMGRVYFCPDVSIHSGQSGLEEAYDDAFIPPETMFSPESCTESMDIWSLGAVLHAMLTGQPPKSYFRTYKEWASCHSGDQRNPLVLPIPNPSDTTFVFCPVQRPGNGEDGGEWSLRKAVLTAKDECAKIVETLKTCSYSSAVQGASLARPFEEFKVRSSLGELLDLVACCLSVEPCRRPSLSLLIESDFTHLDTYELASADKFIKSINLYKSPALCISVRMRTPLRELCLAALEAPSKLPEAPILQLIDRVIDHVHTITTPYTEKIRSVMIDYNHEDSPHTPLARQIVAEEIVDMLIFLCHRYTRAWTVENRKELTRQAKEAEETAKKNTRLNELTIATQGLSRGGLNAPSTARNVSRTKFIDYTTLKQERARKVEEEAKRSAKERKRQEFIAARRKYEASVTRAKRGVALRMREKNRVLCGTCHLVHKLVLEMQFRSSVMAPFVDKVLECLVKLMVGEDYVLASDLAAQCAGPKFALQKPFLSSSDNPKDPLDKEWMRRHKNVPVASYDAFWDFNTYANVFPIFQGTFFFLS